MHGKYFLVAKVQRAVLSGELKGKFHVVSDFGIDRTLCGKKAAAFPDTLSGTDRALDLVVETSRMCGRCAHSLAEARRG